MDKDYKKTKYRPQEGTKNVNITRLVEIINEIYPIEYENNDEKEDAHELFMKSYKQCYKKSDKTYKSYKKNKNIIQKHVKPENEIEKSLNKISEYFDSVQLDQNTKIVKDVFEIPKIPKQIIEVLIKPEYKRTKSQISKITKKLTEIKEFQTKDTTYLYNYLATCTLEKHCGLIYENEKENCKRYMILHGEVEETGEKLNILEKGSEFGDENSIKAETTMETYLLTVALDNYTRIQKIAKNYDLASKVCFLKMVDGFHHLKDEEILGIAKTMKWNEYAANTKIMDQGKHQSKFYIIKTGRLHVIRGYKSEDKEIKAVVKELIEKEYFGQEWVLNRSFKEYINGNDIQLMEIEREMLKKEYLENWKNGHFFPSFATVMTKTKTILGEIEIPEAQEKMKEKVKLRQAVYTQYNDKKLYHMWKSETKTDNWKEMKKRIKKEMKMT